MMDVQSPIRFEFRARRQEVFGMVASFGWCMTRATVVDGSGLCQLSYFRPAFRGFGHGLGL